VTLADAVVFDAEALVAYLAGEPGSDRVAAYVEAVDAGDVDGYASPVTAAEVAAVARGVGDTDTGRGFLAVLRERGVARVPAVDCRGTAAALRADYGLSLGDAFAAATAYETGAALLVGRDRDFDGLPVEVERFRDG
jgi:predicted nucleic acid-binding protein